jgi:hypothetical protein
METEEQLEGQEKSLLLVSGIVGGMVVLLLVGIFAWHQWTLVRDAKVVLHSGYTYTGPTPTPGQAATNNAGKFTVPQDAPWTTINGVKYPYSFEAPSALTLVRLPNDQYDIYAISWNGQTPESNVLIGVDNLTRTPQLKEYVSQPKISYVENWWKQFGALSGVASITPFTNKNGMKGYRARYKIGGNPAPTEDVFFEVTKKPEVVIHLSNGVLSEEVFSKILDTLNWGGTTATKPSPTP